MSKWPSYACVMYFVALTDYYYVNYYHRPSYFRRRNGPKGGAKPKGPTPTSLLPNLLSWEDSSVQIRYNRRKLPIPDVPKVQSPAVRFQGTTARDYGKGNIFEITAYMYTYMLRTVWNNYETLSLKRVWVGRWRDRAEAEQILFLAKIRAGENPKGTVRVELERVHTYVRKAVIISKGFFSNAFLSVAYLQ